jgi:hypothetical protein
VRGFFLRRVGVEEFGVSTATESGRVMYRLGLHRSR